MEEIAPVHPYYWNISDWCEAQPEKFKVEWIVMKTEENFLRRPEFVKYIEIISKNCFDEHKLIWEIKKKKLYYSTEDLPGGLYRTRIYTPEGYARIIMYEGLELDHKKARMVPIIDQTKKEIIECGMDKVCP